VKELKFGDQTLRVRASNLTLLFYKQEFKRDVVGDFAGMLTGLIGGLQAVSGDKKIDLSAIDLSQIDSVTLLQVIWAMAKSAEYNGSTAFPGFSDWLVKVDDLNIFNKETLVAVAEEAASGFFRTDIKQFFKK
jgi:hypothetical protein